MKKLFFSISMMLLSSFSFAQWTYCTTSGTTAKLYSVYTPEINKGEVAGVGAYRWGGGCSWVGMGTSTEVYYSVFFTSADTGYMAGGTNFPYGLNYGIVQKTTSGVSGFVGSNDFYLIDTLMSIYFTSSSTGYGVGSDGLIVKTTDGAINWTTLSSGSVSDLWSVYFPDANTGYVAGVSGTILKTSNGGNTWTAQTSGTTVDLFSICFTDVNTGYAVGNNGTILKTTNGGTNWIPQTSGVTNNLRSVFFPSSTNGYAVGKTGKILKTLNSGLNWVTQASGTSNDLFSIHFSDVNNGYAVGSNGTILWTTNGGGVSVEENLLSGTVINIFPNPTSSTITLSIPSLQSYADVSIFNSLGEEIKILRITKTETEFKIDVERFPAGLYFVRMNNYSGKFVKN